jgi:hypothetical protein
MHLVRLSCHMSLLFGFKRFIAAHAYIVALHSAKVNDFDNTGIAMCVEFFGSVNILARLSPLQLMIIPLLD